MNRQDYVPFRSAKPRFWAAAGMVALIALSVSLADSAVIDAWMQRHNSMESGANEGAGAIVRDPAGDIIVAGSTDNRGNGRDILVIKYSSVDASVLWQRRYNGPGDAHDGQSDLAVDSVGDVLTHR